MLVIKFESHSSFGYMTVNCRASIFKVNMYWGWGYGVEGSCLTWTRGTTSDRRKQSMMAFAFCWRKSMSTFVMFSRVLISSICFLNLKIIFLTFIEAEEEPKHQYASYNVFLGFFLGGGVNCGFFMLNITRRPCGQHIAFMLHKRKLHSYIQFHSW